MAKKPTIEYVDASIARWKTRLKRAMTALDKLEKQKKRLVKAAANPPQPKPTKPAPAVAPAGEQPDIGIPPFLQRRQLDPVAAQIKAEQEETKRQKAAGRIATRKAKKSGETRKMPLTGKAALAAIRSA